MKHLKKIAMPHSWPLARKSGKLVSAPIPGPHSYNNSLPLGIIVRDILGYAKKMSEVKTIANNGKIMVNGKIVKEARFPVGLMDVLGFDDLGQYFRILFNNNGKLMLLKTEKENAKDNFFKVIGKTYLKKSKLQLNLYGGRNLIVDKDEYKVGDTLVMDGNRIKRHLKLEKGCHVYLTGGKKVGEVGVVDEIKTFEGIEDPRIIFKQGNERHETLREYAYVVDGVFEK